MPYADYLQFRTALDGTADLAAFLRLSMTVRDGAFPETHQLELVSGNFFSVLGIQPALGRLIGPADNVVPGGHPVIVLSDFLWRRQFASDPEIVGRQIRVDGAVYDVIGVAPPGFRGAVWPTFQTAFWVPAMMADAYFSGRGVLDTSSLAVFQTVGRLEAGASRQAVQARIDPLDERLSQARETNLYYTNTGAPWRIRALPGNYLRLWPEYRDEVAAFLRILGLMAAAVLAVACANVAMLLLARSLEWRRELALRQALGAGTLDLVRRLGVEMMLLLLAGGLGATSLVLWLSPLVPRLPLTVPYGLELVPDSRTLAIGLVVALATGCTFAVPPVWRALRDPLSLMAGSRTATPEKSGAMEALVMAQVALALILVLGCGLLVRSARNIQQLDPGFQARYGASARIRFPRPAANGDRATRTFVEQLLDSLRSGPRVTSASASGGRPFSIQSRADVRFSDSDSAGPDTQVDTEYNQITADYFETFAIPLRAGRVFTRAEALRGAPVAVASQALATRHWPGRDPVGRLLHWGDDAEPRRIIGVVGDTAGRDRRLTATPTLYLPMIARSLEAAFVSVGLQDDAVGGQVLIREHVTRLDPTVVVAGPTTLAEMRLASTREFRTHAQLAASLAAVALSLALVGLYGLMRYVVHRREREMGIRTALGATPAAIMGMVVGRGSRLALMGVGLGLAASLGTNRLLARLLYAVEPTDPLTFTVVPVLVVVTAVITCWGPARRAARANPTDALRVD